MLEYIGKLSILASKVAGEKAGLLYTLFGATIEAPGCIGSISCVSVTVPCSVFQLGYYLFLCPESVLYSEMTLPK